MLILYLTVNDIRFAGEIGLKAGQHENDFENYGIVVRVKYR